MCHMLHLVDALSICCRREKVTPRRNPTRQARPNTPAQEVERRITRALRKSIGEELADGLQDEQEVKRVVYRT